MASVADTRTRSSTGGVLSRTTLYIVLCAISVVFLLPWAWAVSTSLKPPQDLLKQPPNWIPSHIQWSNYSQVFRQVPFLRYIANTAFITVFSVIGAAASSAVVGYAFGCLRWRGRNILFVVLMATMILPTFVTFIPLYVIYARIGWLNTYLPLIVPAFLGNAFYIFLMRQFFARLPHEIFDSARVDGAGDWLIFLRVAVPLVKPGLIVVVLLQFIASWNDYFGPLVFLNDNSKYTIALGIAFLQGNYGISNFAMVMAAAIISIVPIVILFFSAQKRFTEGVAMTGMKG